MDQLFYFFVKIGVLHQGGTFHESTSTTGTTTICKKCNNGCAGETSPDTPDTIATTQSTDEVNGRIGAISGDFNGIARVSTTMAISTTMEKH